MSADPASLAGRVQDGDRRALARAITLVESTRAEHRRQAMELFEALARPSAVGRRIAVSGPPGAGKSTFIEILGLNLIDRGHRVAVLAIDPSSARSGGAILGDKTRMEQLTRSPDAFIRPSATGLTLGGVARRTREAIVLCEAGGFDTVLIETVGVGQSEYAAARMTDMFILLQLPAGGDELQGIKRGIMELADLVVINKADGEWAAAASRARSDYENALRFLPPRRSSWRPRAVSCSSLEGTGIDEACAIIARFFESIESTGELAAERSDQAESWLWEDVSGLLLDALRQDPGLARGLEAAVEEVRGGAVPASAAAIRLVEQYLRERGFST